MPADAPAPMLRAYSEALDGPPAFHRYSVINGERHCGWSCDASSPHYERDSRLCPRDCGGRAMSAAPEHFARACPGARSAAAPARIVDGAHRPTCGADAAALSAAGVRLLIGVMTGPAPSHAARRDAIRASWMRWESVGSSALVCFLLGGRGLRPDQQAALSAEAERHGDIMWLPDVADEGVPTLKGYAWWTAAAARLDPRRGVGVAHVAKVDDDSFLRVANLQADLAALSCASHLYYGHLAFTGYDPSTWQMCGWSWQAQGSNFNRHRCAAKGAYAPFPFINGALELISAEALRHVAGSAEVRAFVERASGAVEARKAAGWPMSLKGKDGKRGPRVWRQNEDIALGFWLSRAELAGKFNVTHVKINDRAPNMACISTKGMYQRPRDDTVVVHFLKRPAGVRYVWGVLHDRVPHDADNCTRYVWWNNCEGKDARSSYCRSRGEAGPEGLRKRKIGRVKVPRRVADGTAPGWPGIRGVR